MSAKMMANCLFALVENIITKSFVIPFPKLHLLISFISILVKFSEMFLMYSYQNGCHNGCCQPACTSGHYNKVQYNLCKTATLKKIEKWFSRPNIASCRSKVLQNAPMLYFRPSLSYHLSLRSLFCLFLSGRFTQVLLFIFQISCVCYFYQYFRQA